MVRVMCGVQLNDEETSKDLMLILNEAIDNLAVAACVHCVGEDDHVSRRALDSEAEGQTKKGRLSSGLAQVFELQVVYVFMTDGCVLNNGYVVILGERMAKHIGHAILLTVRGGKLCG